MNENEWLREFLKMDFNSPALTKIESIKNFALLWNLFERYFCAKYAKLPQIESNINKLIKDNYIFPETIYKNCYDYYRQRYLTKNKTNKLFEGLGFRENASDVKYKQILKSILENPDSEIKKRILACFIIVYRLRNNLFHGSKNIATLNTQNENFEIANQVIMSFLSFLKNNNKLVELN